MSLLGRSVVPTGRAEGIPRCLGCAATGHWPTMVNDAVLRSIVGLEDPLGVLSIYVSVLPEGETGSRPVWQLELRHELEQACARLGGAAGPAYAVALDRRLGELADELELLVSPRESGRGRALFAGLTGGAASRVGLRQPLLTRVEVGACALARPLASAFEAGRPAGIAFLSRDELRLFEWRLGETDLLESVPVPEFEGRHRPVGSSAARPRSAPQAGSGFHVGQQRDLHERRVEEARRQFVAHALRLGELADRRGWEDIVLAGERSLAESLLDQVRERSVAEILVEPRPLGWLTGPELAGVVEPALDRARSQRQLARLDRARGEALAGGIGAIGLADTLAALAEGRVDRLLVPTDRELRGSRAPDGTLFPPGIEPPGVCMADLHPEELLAERMIQRALATDADVTLLRGETEAALGDDEAAALLRW